MQSPVFIRSAEVRARDVPLGRGWRLMVEFTSAERWRSDRSWVLAHGDPVHPEPLD